jgi:hypothetical protein
MGFTWLVLDMIASLGRSRQVFVMARQELERELGLVLTGLVVEAMEL